jgi:hypothetical protein
VNIVLRRDRETKRRNLCVRGYKVIPLASQAGVLEFVGNTTPLQVWLYAAHQKSVTTVLLFGKFGRPGSTSLADIDQMTCDHKMPRK